MKSRITLRMGKMLEARTAPGHTHTHIEEKTAVRIVSTGHLPNIRLPKEKDLCDLM